VCGWGGGWGFLLVSLGGGWGVGGCGCFVGLVGGGLVGGVFFVV